MNLKKTCWLVLGLCLAAFVGRAQSNVTVRVMAANLTTGNDFSYYTPGIHIFQGLDPDIVAIQEFRYNGSPDTNGLRTLVNTAFDASFHFYCEPGYSGDGDKPNGVISRYPILDAGTWDDTQVDDRGFAWARIDVPGTNDLYVVSVHLHSSGGSSSRAIEAGNLKSLIQSSFPANAWIIVAGDFNTDSRTESCMTTFKSFLSDSPVPVDENNNPNTNLGRDNPYDYVLPSFSLTNRLTPVITKSLTYPSGLVFDSRVYTAGELTNFSPVVSGDSGASGMQHMAVVKDFLIPAGSGPATNPPAITSQPQGRTNAVGANITFAVTATGDGSLDYQWRFNGTNLSGATTTPLVIPGAQITNSGSYTVVITNLYGSVTSSAAVLLITNAPPAITTPPQGQTIITGQNASFGVLATGTAPLSYFWRFNGTNISGATTNPFVIPAVQPADAGDYSVVITNIAGSVTSAVAALAVNPAVPVAFAGILAGWDVNVQTNFGASTISPTTNYPVVAVGGLTRGGGVTTNSTAASRAWGGNGFDSVSSAAAIAASDYATFSVAANTGYKVSFSSISRFDYRRSSSGPPYGLLQYQIGSGSFSNIANLNYSSASTSGASFAAIDLTGFTDLQNVNSTNTVTFRIVNWGASGTNGTWYVFDVASNTNVDFAIEGSIAPLIAPPAAAPELGAATFSGGQLQFTVSGTAGANYIVQSATNLPAASWTPLQTNPAPFIFTETNPVAPQKFYRAEAQ